MSIKHKKNKTNLLKEFNLYTKNKKQYYKVFVWKTVSDLRENSLDSEDASAVVNHRPEIVYIDEDGTEHRKIFPKLGEIHISLEFFNEEVVAHELLHAMLNRIRAIQYPSFTDIDYQEDIKYGNSDVNSEELMCDEFGKWFTTAYRIIFDLWKEHNNG